VFTLYIAWVWTVVATTGRVQRAQDVVRSASRLNGWLSAFLWIFTLTLGGIAYTQSQLNKVWKMQEAPGDLGQHHAARTRSATASSPACRPIDRRRGRA
jgi:hypothetical protein